MVSSSFKYTSYYRYRTYETILVLCLTKTFNYYSPFLECGNLPGRVMGQNTAYVTTAFSKVATYLSWMIVNEHHTFPAMYLLSYKIHKIKNNITRKDIL